METRIMAIIVGIILIGAYVVLAEPSFPTPNPTPYEGDPVTCYRCVDGELETKIFDQPFCPVDWSCEVIECVEPEPDLEPEPDQDSITCYRCLNYRELEVVFLSSICPDSWSSTHLDCSVKLPSKPIETRMVDDSYPPKIPYELDTNHGYLSKDELESVVGKHFNYWKDDPYTETHCCRHMAVEIEQYLETELGIDCFLHHVYLPLQNAEHMNVYVLTDDGSFHLFESTMLSFMSELYIPETLGIYHGNYIYGNYRPTYVDWGTIVPWVENCCDIPGMIRCPTLGVNNGFMGWEYPPSSDIVLPLSILQMVTGQFVVGD